MPVPKQFSIRRKLLRLSLLSASASLFLAGALLVVCDILSFRRSLVESLSSQADIIGYNCASALLFQDDEAALQTLSALKAKSNIRTAAIYDQDRNLFAVWRREALGPPQSLPEEYRSSNFFRWDTLEAYRPIYFNGAEIGTVYIQSDLTEIVKRLQNYATLVFIVFIIAAVTSVLVSKKLGDKILWPLSSLALIAGWIAKNKDYSVRASVGDARDEVGLLVGTFNEMLGHIQQDEDILRRSHDDLERMVQARTRELEATNKELEAFSYSVAHDLRAPLRAIDGFSLAVLEESYETLDNKGKENLKRVRNATQQMAQLIDDILNLSKIARDAMRRETVDLSAIARRINDELARSMPKRRVDVNIDEGMKVTGDMRLLKVVLENLFSNAWKFTAKQASAKIDFGVSPSGNDAAADAKTFIIRDNGVGFDMAYSHKLFGVFQRLHSNREFAGTGIGLATVHRIIQRHGGEIWAEAAVGQGASFYFTL